jgi:uncharacterized protein YdeI (BOF family)
MKLLSIAALAVTLTALAAQAERITPIAETQRGTMVTVTGTVERIMDENEFRLADPTGQILIYLGQNWVPALVGEKVVVHGFVDDDLGPREIYAQSLTRADGTVITFEHY